MSAKKTKEFTLAVRIAGSVNKSFNSSLATASTSLSGFRKKVNSLNSAFTTLDKGYAKIMSVGKKAFTVLGTSATVATVAVLAAGAASIKVGKEFESAFAGVRKTVDATEEEFAKLRSDILEMSTTIPSSAVEIAGVMEIAGQLGIATANLSEFTKTMINLGVSTNLSASEAATALAKFANVTQMDPGDYERLGSTIVDLGNNFATTEADILHMATRLAAAGDLAGLSESQILALATSMSSVGIASESGGSTMSKLLKKIQVAVETNSKSLEDWATVANMSTKEFKDAFEKDAVVALSSFIDGLNDTDRLGKSAIVILDEMGLKEVRLSNTILSLANASGVMTNAIEMANNAWEENTALQEEANKRYETTDSKIQIMKNSFVSLGIAAYDELQGPFRTVLDNITKWVKNATEHISGPNGISKWINDFSVAMPTAIRKIKGAIAAFMKVIDPFIELAKWLWDHPDVLGAVFVSLGTALVTYKIASTLTHIVSALVALTSNPVALTIVGITAAVGAFAGALYYTKKQHERLVRAKIDKAFGDIALSMSEIEEVADHLINSDGALTKLHSVIEEFGELDSLQDGIYNAMRTIKKMNWKVSIGMELSDDDITEYKDSIASYVSGVQDYVTQQQYSLTLAVNLAYGNDDPMGNSIIDSINKFYTDNFSTLQDLGTKLNEAITEAFTDGLLDIDEAKEIQELMQQISDIQSQLAKSNFDAALTSLAIDYDIGSGAQLDADTFLNLQAEVNEQLAAFEAENKESRDKLIQNAALRYSQGYLTKAEYEAEVASIAEQYAKLYDEKVAIAMQFVTQAVNDSNIVAGGYVDAYSAIMKYLEENTLLLSDKILGKDSYDIVDFVYDAAGYGVTAGEEALEPMQKAVDKLLEAMKPNYDYLVEQQEYYKSIGSSVPDYIIQGINDYEAIQELRDATDAPIQMMYDIITNSEYFDFIENKLKQEGTSIDQALAGAITANKGLVSDAVQDMLDELDRLKNYKVQPPNIGPYNTGNTLRDPLGLGERLGGHADGGIFTVPHIAAFAEEGPEAAIPLDGSANAISLWERTGKLLGMGSVLDGLSLGGGSANQSIEYKPTLIFQGQAPSQSDLESAMRTSQDEFEMMMNRYLKEHRRVAF